MRPCAITLHCTDNEMRRRASEQGAQYKGIDMIAIAKVTAKGQQIAAVGCSSEIRPDACDFCKNCAWENRNYLPKVFTN